MLDLASDLISIHEATKILKLNRSRIWVLCNQGRFPGAAKIGSTWVIPREAVENFKRLPPGAKPKTHKRADDEKILTQALETMKGEMSNDGE